MPDLADGKQPPCNHFQVEKEKNQSLSPRNYIRCVSKSKLCVREDGCS